MARKSPCGWTSTRGMAISPTVCRCCAQKNAPKPQDGILWHHWGSDQGSFDYSKDAILHVCGQDLPPFHEKVPNWRTCDAVPRQRLGWVDQGNFLLLMAMILFAWASHLIFTYSPLIFYPKITIASWVFVTCWGLYLKCGKARLVAPLV